MCAPLEYPQSGWGKRAPRQPYRRGGVGEQDRHKWWRRLHQPHQLAGVLWSEQKAKIGPLPTSKLYQKGQDMNTEILFDNAYENRRRKACFTNTANSRQPNLEIFLQIPVICIICVLSDMRNGEDKYLQRICDNSSTDSSLIYIIQTKALFSRTFID